VSDMSDYLPMFVDETGEQLDDLVDVLLVLEREPDSTEELNEAFRLIHSIKGAAGMMGFDNIALLTHHLESYFETLRSGLARLDEPTMNLVLRCTDFLREYVQRLGAGESLGGAGDLLEELAMLARESEDHSGAPESDPVPEDEPTEPVDETSPPVAAQPSFGAEADGYHLAVHFEPGLPLADLKARLILTRLKQIGEVSATRPTESDLDPSEPPARFDVLLTSEQTPEVIRSAAQVDGVQSLDLTDKGSRAALDAPTADGSPKDPVADARATDPAEGDEDSTSDEITGDSENLLSLETPTSVTTTETEETAVADTPDAAIEPTQRAPEAPPSQPTPQPVPGRSRPKSSETMRVDIDRLDKLLNLTGELVVGRARLAQVVTTVGATFAKRNLLTGTKELQEDLSRTLDRLEVLRERDAELQGHVEGIRDGLALVEELNGSWADLSRDFGQITESVDQLTRTADELQHSVLATRMVPVGPLFSRFKRVVRDLANECGKQVALDVRGEKTELDKRMIDELSDPLVHLIRNSIDHGLEAPAVRLARGKPEAGTISLEASHSGNNVFVSVRDDGGGIDASRIRERLAERGIVGSVALAEIDDDEVLQYIWHPGFSTAEEITDISGRGVGLDAVRARIGDINGTIEVTSVPGEGTTFTLRLPLTLAIINCLLVQVRDVVFSLPVENVREIVDVPLANIITLHSRRTIDVRGEFIPLLRVSDIFDWERHHEDAPAGVEAGSEQRNSTVNAVILRVGERVLALRVDGLLGSQDIVIKSLSENFVSSRGLSGASILGDGSVCLMLDIAAMIELAREQRANEPVAEHEA
jgi:two-component system chemotaxis sensor kinase CheA